MRVIRLNIFHTNIIMQNKQVIKKVLTQKMFYIIVDLLHN
jgi:hypothetical protein